MEYIVLEIGEHLCINQSALVAKQLYLVKVIAFYDTIRDRLSSNYIYLCYETLLIVLICLMFYFIKSFLLLSSQK